MKIKAALYFLITVLAGYFASAIAESSKMDSKTNIQLCETQKVIEIKSTLPIMPSLSTRIANTSEACGDTVIITRLDWENEELPPGWTTVDLNNDDGKEYTWGRSECGACEGNFCGWCAAGGKDKLDPCTESYPDNCDSWLLYTEPMDLSDVSTAGAIFKYRLDSEIGSDYFKWAITLDFKTFYINRTSASTTNCHERTVDFFSDYKEFGILEDANNRKRVYFAIGFDSDATNSSGKGAFVDDIIIYKIPKEYTPPQQMILQQNNKSVDISWPPPLASKKEQKLQRIMKTGALLLHGYIIGELF
jgi:hypothetical protein